MGQGQPRVIIWTTLVVLSYTMLHTKFQGKWSIGSGEEDFLKFFTINGDLGHVTRTVWTIFRSSDPCMLLMKFGYSWTSSFRGEVVWNCGRTTTTDDRRRTTEPSHPISSPGDFGSGELKMPDLKQSGMGVSHCKPASQRTMRNCN